MAKLSDYVINFLKKKGINDIFLVSGGGIMHLTDSVGRKINYVSNMHEQASAIAAEAYARVSNNISACLVTVGPGGTNTITGVAGAWTDSVPMIVLAGQVRTDIIADYSKIRQLGPQELNMDDIVRPITKYVTTIKKPEDIRFELEKAIYIAKKDRPGPVWLNIPLDIQGTMIDERKLKSYSPPLENKTKTLKKLKKDLRRIVALLEKSKRPVLILGSGIRSSGSIDLLEKFLKKINMPVLLSYSGLDLVPTDHPLLIGKYGPVGQRAGNFALQNSDLLLCLGASLSFASTGFDLKGFAPKAKKVMVNIDKGELTKPTAKLDYRILADARDFIELFLKSALNKNFRYSSRWFEACKYWKKKYPSIIPEFYKDKKHVNTYVFIDKLSDLLTAQDILVTGNSLDAVSMYQAFKVKKNQRAFTNANLGSMGYCLPSSIGACIANNRRRTILFTGDGTIQFNIQELSTIRAYDLPIKIFVINNRGYESIRSTQDNYFKGRYVGSDSKSGVVNPDFKTLAKAYRLSYEYIANNGQIKNKILKVLKTKGAVICELNVNPNQHRVPKISSFKRDDGTLESRPLEDMAPFLPREELWENMHMFDNGK